MSEQENRQAQVLVEAQIAQALATSYKLNAETMKLTAELRWYPIWMSVSVLGGIAAAAVGVAKIILG